MGNIYGGKLYYSDNGRIITDGSGFIGEQPFMTKNGIYYTHNRGIYFNGDKILILWDDYKEMGNPCLDGDWIYFEARRDPAPHGWGIWRYNAITKVTINK